MPRVKLGLIGEKISESRSPRMHKVLGEFMGLDVSYERFSLEEAGDRDPLEMILELGDAGYAGVNVTFPIKERIAAAVPNGDAIVARVGACNTVKFHPEGVVCYNTDYIGFIRSYQRHLGDHRPGTVLVIGAGGVGRAVIAGLLDIGADQIRIYDIDSERANGLVKHFAATGVPSWRLSLCTSIEEGRTGASGLVNCTPVGMAPDPGCPVRMRQLEGLEWVADSVYFPQETELVRMARGIAASVVTGFGHFVYQGISAFEIFTGVQVPADVVERFFASDFHW